MTINGITLDVNADIKQVTKMLGRLQQGKINKAATRALNKTATNVRTQAVRLIANDIGVKQKQVRANIILARARRNFLQASLIATKRRFTLIELDPRARQTARGVQIKQQGVRRIIPHAFIITRRQSGQLAIVKRKTAKRYPLIELRGESVAMGFNKFPARQLMQQTANQAWLKHFQHELHYEISKL